jgi:hypothetical protein
MTSYLVHKVLQALLMLATADVCPEADWYDDALDTPSTEYVVVQRCAIPLAPGLDSPSARAFYRAARKAAGR